jgi:ribonuclease E
MSIDSVALDAVQASETAVSPAAPASRRRPAARSRKTATKKSINPAAPGEENSSSESVYSADRFEAGGADESAAPDKPLPSSAGSPEPSSAPKSRRRGGRGRARKNSGVIQEAPEAAPIEAFTETGSAPASADSSGQNPDSVPRASTVPALSKEYLPAVQQEGLPAISAPGSLEEALLPPEEKTREGKDSGRERSAASSRKTRATEDKQKGRRKMFVSVLAGEQLEVVVADEGNIREYYVEMLHQTKMKGNIYKGIIHNVDPNLQAAFVSYGAAKNGFLQIDEVHPEYYLNPHDTGKGHKYPLIQKVLKAGQEILVQVVKEPSGSKGAFLTSYLSLPGRYLVLTPGREQIGVSRKVGNDEERNRLRETLDSLKPGPGLGVIVRTVSEGASKTNLQRDLRVLKRLWQDIRKKGSSEQAPALIYQELGLAARAVRDYLTEDIAELWIDDEGIASQMREIISLLFPRRADLLHLHNEAAQSLFERFGLAKQIRQVQSREVILPSGGRLVFDHTEALTAIDINSGHSGGKSNFEDMAFKINLEAARHIPLQLRLRDIGGQVVVDFIEMHDRAHWREVEKTFRQEMKEDRARHDVGKISDFGLLEVVRQRLSSSAISVASEPCPFCKGTGIRRNMEWQAMQALQEIRQLVRQNAETGKTLVYSAAGELVLYLLNNKKERLLEMEQDAGVRLELRPGI